ncbi:MAG: tetratricopeptide repeat protein [Actinobacteria bacterium]|nr:tetratricopeptide repeat protein [Actinomycetota bacterium]
MPGIPPDELGRVTEALGDVRNLTGQFPLAARAYREARRLRGDEPTQAARLMLKEAGVARRAGRYPDALRWLTRARGLLRGPLDAEATAILAQVSVWSGQIRQEQGRVPEAVRWLERAVGEAEAAHDLDALAHAYYALDLAALNLGTLREPAMSYKAITIYEHLGDLGGQANVLNNLGGFAYYEGRWDEAVALYERGRAAREKTGDSVNAAFGTVNVGEIRSDQGRLEEAEPLLRQALQVWRAAGYRSGVAYALGQLARAASRSGRHDEAIRMFDEARALAREIGSEFELAEATLARPGGGVLAPLLHRVRACALAVLGEGEAAASALATALDEATERENDYELALVLEASARVARVAGTAPDPEAGARSRTILRRLGVTALPEIPGLA